MSAQSGREAATPAVSRPSARALSPSVLPDYTWRHGSCSADLGGSTYRMPSELQCPGESARAAGQPTVLVVEDDQPLADLMIDLLHDVGVKAQSARDGLAALEELHHRPYVVVVLDLDLPRLDGNGVLRAIEQEQAEKPSVLVVSANPQHLQPSLKHLVRDILTKPFDISAFLDSVARLINRTGLTLR